MSKLLHPINTYHRQTYVTSTPVELYGFQAIVQPSKFGYSLATIIPDLGNLEADREDCLHWCASKSKERSCMNIKPEPWEPFNGGYKIKFSWNEDNKPLIFDSKNKPIRDTSLIIDVGSLVNIAFYQKPYILKDGVTVGTTLKLLQIQLVRLGTNPSKSLFTECEGYEYI